MSNQNNKNVFVTITIEIASERYSVPLGKAEVVMEIPLYALETVATGNIVESITSAAVRNYIEESEEVEK